MRHLPNLLTLANLFCGCLAIVYVLNAQPFLFEREATPDYQWNAWVYGVQQMQMGGLFIFLAGFFDLLDGWVARALKIFSPIGKDLDSLADVVSFGVAPSMILYKLLWDAIAHEPHVMDVDTFSMAPAFLVACFAALRLAKFNITPGKKGEFTGMPTPAVGIFVASLALMDWDNPNVWSQYLQYRWALYALIAVLCFLMVSKIRFLKLMPASWNIKHSWPQAMLVVGTIAAIPFIRFSAIPFAFLLYIIVSLVAPKSKEQAPPTNTPS